MKDLNQFLCISLGNLLNRTLGLLKKNCQSTLAVDAAVAVEGSQFKDTVENLVSLFKFTLLLFTN